MSFYKENNSSHFICFHYFFLEKRIMIVIGMMGSSMHIFYIFSLFFSWKKDHDSYRHHGEFHAYLLYVFIIFFLGKKIMIVIGMMGSSMDEFSLLLFLIRRTSFLYMTTCNWILTSAAPVVQGCLNFHQKVKMSSLLWERNKIYLS